jgi:drug/metabolite transporter (DMT)-like permease
MFASLLLLAFGAMLCWGVGDFLIQRSSRLVGSLESLTIIAVVGGVLVTPFILPELHLLANLTGLLLLFCLGAITFTAGYLNFEALREGKIAVVDVIVGFELPVTIGLSLFAFGERLTWMQSGMVAAIFLGIILISVQRGERLRWEKGALLALVVAFFMGVVNFLTASSARLVTPLMAIWLPWLVTGALCLFVLWKKNRITGLIAHARQFWVLVLAMAIVDTAAWTFYAFAVRGGEVSLITAITESYPVVAITLGLAINKERLAWHQFLGGALALGASILLATTL